MQKHLLRWGSVLMMALGLCVLTGVLSSAEAVIMVRSAAVLNGVAVVEGGNAARSAPISWEGARVTQANNGGNFAFQGGVPADCVGRLEDGVPADAVDVALANCVPEPPPAGAPAPVPQTGQTTVYATGDDGDLQAGVAWPVPRFTDHGNGTVTDRLTGLIWLKHANCIGRSWTDAFAAIADLNAGVIGCVEYVPGTFADWRLPNINELRSLIDFRFFSPTLSNAAGTAKWTEGDAFFGTVTPHYWSSTTAARLPGIRVDRFPGRRRQHRRGLQGRRPPRGVARPWGRLAAPGGPMPPRQRDRCRFFSHLAQQHLDPLRPSLVRLETEDITSAS